MKTQIQTTFKGMNDRQLFFTRGTCADILKAELKRRQKMNSRYSQRAFARDLKIDASRLSAIINGKKSIASSSAKAIAKKLGWDSAQTKFFQDLASMKTAKNEHQKKIAKQNIENRVNFESQRLSIEEFSMVSQWYHFAILELTLVCDFKSQVPWIAKRLGLPNEKVQIAVERMLKMGLLEQEGDHWKASTKFTSSTDGVPSRAIRQYHRQIMLKAMDSLETQDMETRTITNMTLAFDSKQFKEAKEFIREFRRSFSKRFPIENKDSVYCLAVQFFKMG